ncbi:MULTISPECIES: sodium/glutamate symporter [Clostridium]|uniref:Sodium/glutamate symporter n=1 Tax=Clostridium cadaveris TaxID=1529 RepID=A0A1I2L602_9CLOT|nr:sodium/glutamate symporter [Clostridium cadaveris]MDU4951567.1 sodium/glutamate symporter [Clostridium sp.]MDM8312446.1 sodium/glutamate symporter [Clostridium cadaveris]MDY4949651.1 sodium/glutamate symporter [Clostridium cadaveris]NME63598.1 sodium/glutamate symporter [Clostridium cadaveris]NWK09872.1 sodium/glutamate symporter [Clostridium cadaveris]
MELNLDMIQTLALAIVAYYVGSWLKKKVSFLEKFCIPSPVVGGLIFSILTLILKEAGILTVSFDTTLQSPCMLVFFTSVGLTANFQVIKKGGKLLIIFAILTAVLLTLQNVVGVGLAKVLGQNPLLGLMAGSITMTGGHGTGGSWALVFEESYGITGAMAITMAAATFGLVSGSLMGGPLGRKLILKNGLKPAEADIAAHENVAADVADAKVSKITLKSMFDTFGLMAVCMGLGTIIVNGLKNIGITMPSYIGAMIIACVIVNVAGKKLNVHPECNDILGNMGLNVFLSMALISLKLWELKAVAGPLLIILLAQTLLMALFAYFVTFRLCGKNFDAAVLAAGHCGFGMGATPNAMANMDAVTSRFGPSPTAYLVIPIVGAFLVDFMNLAVITAFVNMV